MEPLPKMPLLKLFSLLCFFLLLSSSSSSSHPDLFESWLARHDKRYSSEAEKLSRRRAFEDNLAFVTAHNSGGAGSGSYTLGLNAFADLTVAEFRSLRLGLSPALIGSRRGENGTLFRGSDAVSVPDKLDWREKGAVTHVKDQASCGACWAFSSTGAIEGINQIKTGSLVSLSEQELIDCDRTYNSGCNGGLMDYAYKWIIQNHGIDSEDDYPYKARESNCLKNKLQNRAVTIDGYTDVLQNNEDALLQAVATQPVSVGICGSERAFQLYSKGIFTGPCSTSLDHAVLIVGYGSQNGIDYWILKNSWGTGWGMDGYMHMQRNSGSKHGICGINMMASYPTKTSPNPPPSPGPGPAKCSLFAYCPAGSTCCCTRRIFGMCFSWSCCGLESAVCCKDHRYCCPHDYPVCDSSTKQCFKGIGNFTSVEGIERKSSHTNLGSWYPLLEAP
ncbi:low-temperature-induced cysteine proteinase [Iris pallida]|uniref:Low-temperature-induced cysteine proteinase n=1 Tax=Iris pallida TaxID=29817 RepID=A0AAX6GBC9_IRIPA|nr:low-temperature-induced cysteine proteinase [Iris pallida]